MRPRHLGVILLASVLMTLLFVPSLFAQDGNDQDSIWVNVSNYSSNEVDGKLELSFTWDAYIKKYTPRGNKYGEWANYPLADSLTYKAMISTDSAFTQVVKQDDVQGKETTFRELEFGMKYFVKVEPVGIVNPWKAPVGQGQMFQGAAGADGDGGNIFKAFWEYSIAGGVLMPAIYLFALFGLLVCWPVTWWKLRLANIFPPNKAGLMYTILPLDRTGKTDFMTEKGNAYVREITKYWGKAMEAQSIKPSLWKDEEEFIKATQQDQEEMKKKLWIKVGLPNIEKAIDICKNGVPGVKLPKKPLEYPFAKVFLAVLENHRANKNAWWTSQEMDRAMANTSEKELGALEGWTVNALWALGSVEPMLGLFGTVIGIRSSFATIVDTLKTNPNAEMKVIVPELAGGIQVALITTITGLAFGVPFTLLHYYYKGKVSWIAGKWEEIIIDVLNRA